MEDYIFIIIAIILSVLGAFNRKNKKKIGEMEGDNGAVQEPSFFEKQFVDPFFDDVEEGPEPVFAQPAAPKPEPVAVPKTKPTIIREAKVELEEDQLNTLEEEVDHEETRLDGIMKDFSLKKAVIYSEILQRKY